MKRHIEFKYTLSDYTPLVIQTEGDDLEDCLANATYNVDVPDPMNHYDIGNLHQADYDAVVARITDYLISEAEYAADMRSER